jgi:uncharacterized protein
MSRPIRIFLVMILIVLAFTLSCRSDGEAPQKGLILKRPTAESGDAVNVFAELRVGLHVDHCCEVPNTGKVTCVTTSYVNDTIIATGASATLRMWQDIQGGPGFPPIPSQVDCRVTRGGFGIDSNLALSDGKWDGKREGAVHRLQGKLAFCGYEFDSAAGNPLTFQLTKDGYKFLYGSGTVKDAETQKVHELKDSSKIGELLQAAASGELDLVKKLIASGTPVDSRRPYGDTPLITACRSAQSQATTPKIESGTTFRAEAPDSAARLLETAEFLIDKGADLNAADALLGRTPLMTAVAGANWDLASMLIRKGADVNIKDRYEDAPLLEAARKCELNPVQACLGAEGANPDVADSSGRTPLSLCATQDTLSAQRRQDCADAARLLLEKGASPNAADKQKVTPLMRASHNNFPELVTLLLDKGAEIDAVDHEGATALMHACFVGRITAVETLLNRGANVNIRAKNGVTALQIANGKKWAKIVEILRTKGAR